MLMLKCGWGEERNHVFTAPTPLGADPRPAECISSKYLCKEIKANVSFSGICLAISCITYPVHTAKHTVMESFDSNAKHAPSAGENYFLNKSKKEFPFTFEERGGRPYPLIWLSTRVNYSSLWKRWGVISW